MKKLSKVVLKNGFTYNQLIRKGMYALYEQINSEGILAGHEMGLIKIGKEKEIFEVKVPERELFFADTEFGISAWSLSINREVAVEKFKTIKNRFPECPKKK